MSDVTRQAIMGTCHEEKGIRIQKELRNLEGSVSFRLLALPRMPKKTIWPTVTFGRVGLMCEKIMMNAKCQIAVSNQMANTFIHMSPFRSKGKYLVQHEVISDKFVHAWAVGIYSKTQETCVYWLQKFSSLQSQWFVRCRDWNTECLSF